MTNSRWRVWLVLVVLLAIAIALVMVPMVLIQPFAPQTPAQIALAFALRRWSPALTLILALGVVLVGARLWRAQPRVLPRILVTLAGLVVLASAWMARQDYFEWMFAPLPDARFVRAAQATFVAPGDMVLTVAGKGDAIAYPVRQLAYHHLVEDAVGDVPIVATY
jgi:hypothetical protein